MIKVTYSVVSRPCDVKWYILKTTQFLWGLITLQSLDHRVYHHDQYRLALAYAEDKQRRRGW